MSKKIVLKVNINSQKGKRRVMKTVAGIEGVESVEIDTKGDKITVVGDADPVFIAQKLRKFVWSELVSVGPAKEPEKKVPEKKDEIKDEKKDARKDEKKADLPMTSIPEPNISYVYLPKKCDRCSGYTFLKSHENPNACSIS